MIVLVKPTTSIKIRNICVVHTPSNYSTTLRTNNEQVILNSITFSTILIQDK